MNYSEALEQQIGALRRITDPKVKEYWWSNWEDPGSISFLRASWPALVWSMGRSEPVYIGRDICQMLGAVAAQGVPPWTLTDELPLVQRGFCWFEANPGYRDPNDHNAELTALSWAPYWMSHVLKDGKEQTAITIDGPAPGALRASRVLMIHPWYSPRQLGHRGITAPWVPVVMTFGSSSGQISDVRASDKEPLNQSEKYDIAFLASVFGTLSLFAKQRLLTSERQQVDRHARKRIAKEAPLVDPTVRVVKLRTRETISHDADRGEAHVDWACRWMVRGHWRQQFFPSRKAHQPIWITPHIKGPDDKPLRTPRATVFAVVQ
jgi:hypothetical protein